MGGVQGRLTYTGGNGSNAVTYNMAISFSRDVLFNFGSGINSLVLQPGNGTSAKIGGLTVYGVHGANNTYDDSAVQPARFPVRFINFP